VATGRFHGIMDVGMLVASAFMLINMALGIQGGGVRGLGALYRDLWI